MLLMCVRYAFLISSSSPTYSSVPLLLPPSSGNAETQIPTWQCSNSLAVAASHMVRVCGGYLLINVSGRLTELGLADLTYLSTSSLPLRILST